MTAILCLIIAVQSCVLLRLAWLRRRDHIRALVAANRPHAERPRVTARLVGGPRDGMVTDMSADAVRVIFPVCRADGHGYEQAVYEVAEETRTLRHVERPLA